MSVNAFKCVKFKSESFRFMKFIRHPLSMDANERIIYWRQFFPHFGMTKNSFNRITRIPEIEVVDKMGMMMKQQKKPVENHVLYN